MNLPTQYFGGESNRSPHGEMVALEFFPLQVPVQFMRHCPACECEQLFLAGWRCSSGLAGVCIACGRESIALWTHTNSEAA
jgi:hypothetical protein